MWSLYEVAGRIDAANGPAGPGCVERRSPPARVDLVAGRIEVEAVRIELTPEERKMLARQVYAPISSGPAFSGNIDDPRC